MGDAGEDSEPGDREMNKREGSDGEMNRVMTLNREVELTWRKEGIEDLH